MRNNLLFLFILLALFACQKSFDSIEEEKKLPPGYQKEIPWPSLANSPWPKFQGDAQCTGRSKSNGPATGMVSWQIDSIYGESGCVIGIDSTIIFMSSRPVFDKGGVNNYHFSGKKNWFFRIHETIANRTTPLVLADGTIIVSTYLDGKIMALTSNGSIKWSYSTSQWIQLRGMNVGLDNTIYFVDSDGFLNAISELGYLQWRLTIEETTLMSSSTVLSFSGDGKTLYVSGMTKSLFAVDVESKKIKWTFGENGVLAGPVVDSDGNIYILGMPENIGNNKKSYLTKLNSYGAVIWRYFFGTDINFSYEPAIDRYGNIYFAGMDSLYSINYLGILRWKKRVEGCCDSPISCDINNIIYVSISKAPFKTQILALNSNGVLIWESDILNDNVGDSPALGYGFMFFPTHRSRMFYVIQ